MGKNDKAHLYDRRKERENEIKRNLEKYMSVWELGINNTSSELFPEVEFVTKIVEPAVFSSKLIAGF